MTSAHVEKLQFAELAEWAADDHRAALDVFLATAPLMTAPAWQNLGRIAERQTDARGFFEDHFDPVVISDGASALFTGYYEPEFRGARRQGGAYQYPIYATPADLRADRPYLTRREIEETRPLAGKGYEIAWLCDPVDLFFLQVQGSGRIILPDGAVLRVGFAAKNGYAYTSVGKLLVARGVFTASDISAAAIRDWIAENPVAGRALLLENDSYVFFREITGLPDHAGPIGTMGRPVTANRSLAIDPAFTPLGAPVWIEKTGPAPIARLMVAQDTGGAIRGAQRADIFFGSGYSAGAAASAVQDGGRMVTLLPKSAPEAL